MGRAETSPLAVYTPQHRVLAGKLLGVGLFGLAWFGITVLGRWRAQDWPYFRDVLPVHLLLAGMIGIYLIYLSFALYRCLGRAVSVERSGSGLTVRSAGQVRELRWADIRQVRFGDLYLKLDTAQGRIEIPFICRADQREIYRCHHRAVGLRPDSGRFLAPR